MDSTEPEIPMTGYSYQRLLQEGQVLRNAAKSA
jgi:hypothetical protein